MAIGWIDSYGPGKYILDIFTFIKIENATICLRHYKQWSKNLFTGYVRHFLALKVQASGWPPECRTEEQKAKFLEMYAAIGVKIDPAKVEKNPGLRFIA
jgi:hypothetical protein